MDMKYIISYEYVGPNHTHLMAVIFSNIIMRFKTENQNDLYMAHRNSIRYICHQLKIRHLYGTFNFSTQCICMGTRSLFVHGFRGKAVFVVVRTISLIRIWLLKAELTVFSRRIFVRY